MKAEEINRLQERVVNADEGGRNALMVFRACFL